MNAQCQSTIRGLRLLNEPAATQAASKLQTA